MSARRRIDASRIAQLASRPGADPRVWITFADVTQLGFDPDEGIFADLTFQPSGTQETALIGAPYAGNEFGDWCPLNVGDVVLVAVPLGDPGTGPTIITRVWKASDKPSADFKAEQQQDGADVPTQDRVLRVQPGQKYKVRTSGNGDGFDFQVEGDGNVVIKAAQGEMLLQGGTQKFIRGDDRKQGDDVFLTALDVYADAISAAVGGSLIPATTTFKAAITGYKQAITSSLSSKIKGE